MEQRSVRAGGAVFGAAMIGMGVLALVRLDLVPDIEPVPAWVPGHAPWAVATGALLVGAGACLVVGRRVRAAAATIATFLACWVVPLHLPRLVAQPANGGYWVVACESLALCAVAAVLAAQAGDGVPDATWDRLTVAARTAFGATFLLFGLSHFLYRGYVESVIPAWIPAHGFWAVATGLAHLAAGVSLLTRVRARLAATLLAIMFGTWVVILHAPRVAAASPTAPRTPNEWSSLLIALAMCGGSWLVAGSLTVPNAMRARSARRDAPAGSLAST